MSSDLKASPRRCGIALGANLGDRVAQLSVARRALRELHEGEDETFLCSPVFESDPVDCAVGDPLFANAVIELQTSLEPVGLLGQTQRLEAEAGRGFKRARHAPRPLDLDLLYLDELILGTADLTVPHPRIGQRRFVLEPLASIRPALTLPNESETVADLLANLSSDESVLRLLADIW